MEIIIFVPGLGPDAINHPIFLPFLGSSLLERHIRFAKKLGASGTTVITGSESDTAVAESFLAACGVSGVETCTLDAWKCRPGSGDAEDTLLLRADYLVEEPVLRYMTGAMQSCLLSDHDEIAIPGAAWFVGSVGGGQLYKLISGEKTPAGMILLESDAFPHFNPGLRRHRRSGWLQIEAGADLARAKEMLIDGAQKGSLDIPAKYLHAPLENAIVSRVAQTSITPNQITVYTTAAAWLMTWLILIDQVWAGLAGAAVVGILDGVDGKLARLKLMTSRLGEMEHLLDMMFEYSWWLALGWTLGGGDTVSPLFWMSIGLILCNFGDTLAGALFWVFRGRAVGRTIDNYSKFDLGFRLVAGRRNIYIWMLLLLGPFAGLENALVACFAWAVITVLIRMSRALLHIARPRNDKLANFLVG